MLKKFFLVNTQADNMDKFGRPEVDLPEGWKDTLINLGKNGKGPVHMARALGIARSTFYLLKDRDKDFSDTFEEAMQEAQIWWENVGQEGIFMGGKDNPFQSSLWSFIMANKFGWASKQEVKEDSNQKIQYTRTIRD
jgi:hypothetical protein